MKIKQKHTVFSKEEFVALTKTDISRNRNGKTTECIRLEDVQTIKLLCEGSSTAHGKTVHRCVVKSSSKKIVFSNAIYGGIDNDQMDKDYKAIVENLCRRVSFANPEVKIIEGSNLYLVLAWFCMIMGVLVLLALPLAMIFGAEALGPRIYSKAWLLMALPVMIGGFAYPLIKKGRAKQIKLAELKTALPGGQS